MNKAAWLTGLVSGFLLGVAVAGVFVLSQRPYCPTEDSCGYGWDNGPKIVEVTP